MLLDFRRECTLYAREQNEDILLDPANGHVLFRVPGTFGSLKFYYSQSVPWVRTEKDRYHTVAIKFCSTALHSYGTKA